MPEKPIIKEYCFYCVKKDQEISFLKKRLLTYSKYFSRIKRSKKQILNLIRIFMKERAK